MLAVARSRGAEAASCARTSWRLSKPGSNQPTQVKTVRKSVTDTELRGRRCHRRGVRAHSNTSRRSFHIHGLTVETQPLEISLGRAEQAIVAQGVSLRIPATNPSPPPARRGAAGQALGMISIGKRRVEPSSGGEPQAAEKPLGGETEGKQGRSAFALKLWQVKTQQHSSKRTTRSKSLHGHAGSAQAGRGNKDDRLPKDLQEARHASMDRTAAQQRPQGAARLQHGIGSTLRHTAK